MRNNWPWIALIVILGLLVAYYEFVRSEQWKAEGKASVTREEVSDQDEVYQATIEEVKKELERLESIREKEKQEYLKRERRLNQQIARLRTENEEIKETYKKNEELLSRLHGFELFERVLARTDELLLKHPDPGAD
jgi:flagellar motility protein MotE (MotC chaperone)